MQKTAESNKQKAILQNNNSNKKSTSLQGGNKSSVLSSTITLVTSLFLISLSLSEAKNPHSQLPCFNKNKLLTVSKDNSGTEGQ